MTETEAEVVSESREDAAEGLQPAVENEEHVMPQMVDIIINDQMATVLCEDGSVWSCLAADAGKDAVKLSGLENITKILCGGPILVRLVQVSISDHRS